MSDTVDTLPPVFEYADPRLGAAMAKGEINTSDDQILENIAGAIRRGHPQVRPFGLRTERLLLVGSGPSLNSSLDALRQLHFEGAKIVSLNGAYHWCLAHNLRPSTHIVLDARPSNARFVEPAVPQCRYLLASQCAPAVWDAVAGRPEVWIFHAHAGETSPIAQLLNGYYGPDRWCGIGGGVTVATRALVLLRLLGYVRFDLFGVDCCWLGDTHHAIAQPENAGDRCIDVTVALPDGTGARTFRTSPWMLKQFEDFVHLIRLQGSQFLLQVHGEGLLAYALTLAAGDGWANVHTTATIGER